MEKNQPVFLIAGPPAVGKSTTSAALAARFARSVHIPVDDLRMMVVSGLEMPGADWNEALVQQISLARANASHMAQTYADAGFMVALDDFLDLNFPRDYHPLLSRPGAHAVLLYPRQTAAHQRNYQRAGDSPGRAYIDEGIQLVYDGMKAFVPFMEQNGWQVLDTTELSIEETVDEILRRAGITPG